MAHKNILLLVADDLGKYINCYGCRSAPTPVLDRLAAQGTRFEMAFASTASCSGSRSTIYTGLHTHENGQYGLNIFRTHFQTFPHVLTAPRLFNDAGYFTGIIGKVHVGPDDVYPWTHRVESESRDVAWVADQVDAFFASAVDSENAPFFLTVGFVDPHRDITTRGGFGNDGPFDARVKDWRIDPKDVWVPDWLPDLPETRQELADYYRAIHRTDQGVGFILDALEKRGLVDSTLVVFTSDNGPPFINAKTTLYDAGTCLPLIVRQPGGAAGVVNPNMVSFIDILPTILDWAGIALPSAGYINANAHTTSTHVLPGSGYNNPKNPPSPPLLGRSFLPILSTPTLLPPNEWQHHVFGSHTFHELQNYWPTRTLRTRRYKYHRNIAWRLDFPFAADLYASYTWEGIRQSPAPFFIGHRTLKNYLFRPAEELFDLETDPDEVKNLVGDGDGEHESVLKEMREVLEAWQQKTHDLWLNRDGVSLEMLQRYAKDGLKVPNRLDIDVERPLDPAIEMMSVESGCLLEAGNKVNLS